MLQRVYYIRLENPPADFPWKGLGNISLTMVIRNALERKTPLVLRSLVVAILCRLRLITGHVIGSLVSTRMTGFQNSRSSWQHLIVRGRMYVITVIGSMVETACRAC